MNVFDQESMHNLIVNFKELTKEQRAGKLLHHAKAVKGVPFLVWSKYDEHGDLVKRIMIRESETKTDGAGYMKMEGGNV